MIDGIDSPAKRAYLVDSLSVPAWEITRAAARCVGSGSWSFFNATSYYMDSRWDAVAPRHPQSKEVNGIPTAGDGGYMTIFVDGDAKYTHYGSEQSPLGKGGFDIDYCGSWGAATDIQPRNRAEGRDESRPEPGVRGESPGLARCCRVGWKHAAWQLAAARPFSRSGGGQRAVGERDA